MAEPKPLAARATNRYVYYPGGAPQFEYTAVNVKNRSHTITAHVEIPEGGAEGVLLAHGSWFGGYALYVKGGRLHYVHNYLGLAEYRISADGRAAGRPGNARLPLPQTGEHRASGRCSSTASRSARARSRAPSPASSRRPARASAAATTAACR